MSQLATLENKRLDAICYPDYLKPGDFLRPFMAGAIYGLVFSFLPMLSLGPMFLVGMTLICGLEILLFAVMHWGLWRYRLRKHGSGAFIVKKTLNLTFAQSLELGLAATANLKKSEIIGFDEAKGIIKLKVPGNNFTTVGREVRVTLESRDEATTDMRIDTVISVTKLRDKILRAFWGDTWYPLIIRNDVNLNAKLLAEITAVITHTPNWDYKHDHGQYLSGRPNTSIQIAESQMHELPDTTTGESEAKPEIEEKQSTSAAA